MIQQATKGVLFLSQAKAIKDPKAIHPLFTLAGFVAWGKGAGKGVRSLLSHKIVTGVKTMRCLTMKFGIRGGTPLLRSCQS